MWTEVSFVLTHSRVWRTNEQTDGFLMAIPRLHSCSAAKRVVLIDQLLKGIAIVMTALNRHAKLCYDHNRGWLWNSRETPSVNHVILTIKLYGFYRTWTHVHVRYMSSYVRLSVVCLSVTFVHPTQAIEIFGNVSRPFGTLAIFDLLLKVLRRLFQGNSYVGVKRKRGNQI